jgi:hypothetical protein
MKKNNFINKWLDENQDPEIAAKVKAEAEQKYKAMKKTPMQEVEEYVLDMLRTAEVDMGTYGLIELKFREMRKKEKDMTCEFAALYNAHIFGLDNRTMDGYPTPPKKELSREDFFDTTFNTKEK